MKNFIIFCPSEKINKDKICLIENSTKIAVDSGISTAFFLDVTPDILVGDLDSADKAMIDPMQIEVLQYPSEKDDTDLMIAIKYAVERGADNVQIIGGMYGRIDHTLANLMALYYMRDHNCEANITDGYNRVRIIKDERIVVKKLYKYISLIPIEGDLTSVYIKGLKYELTNANISLKMPITISNEFKEDTGSGEIAVKGTALLCECDDI